MGTPVWSKTKTGAKGYLRALDGYPSTGSGRARDKNSFLFVFCHVTAMETVKKDPSIPSDNICHLDRMPVEILNHISRFLMESEEQFIARTSVKKEMTAQSLIFFKNRNVACARWSLCADEDKAIAVFQPFAGHKKYEAEYYLMISDVDKKRAPKAGSLFECKVPFVEWETYEQVALSCGRGRIARCWNKWTSCMSLSPQSGLIRNVAVQKIDLKENTEGKQVIDLGRIRVLSTLDFKPISIDFNKQGTHLIIHGENLSVKKVVYKIIPLKVIDPAQKEVEIKTTNELQGYLRDKFVCNKCIEGKK